MKQSENAGARTPKSGERATSIFAAGLLLLCVLLALLWVLFAPKEPYSQEENRALQGAPQVSAQALLNGAFQEQLSDFTGDQFPARLSLIGLSAAVREGLGQKDLGGNYMNDPAAGGVYLGENGHLYEVLLPWKSTLFEKNGKALAAFAEAQGLPFTMVPVPSGAWEQQSWLPENAPLRDQRADYLALSSWFGEAPNAAVVDLFGTLSLAETGRDLYYKTDHHWNLYGAYEAYAAFVRVRGGVPVPLSDYALHEVAPFYGTLSSKAMRPTGEADRFLYPISKEGGRVTQTTGNTVQEGLLWERFLSQKDKYSAFLGGNHALDVLKNTGAKSSKKLLVLKDSYFNSMAPFLIEEYAEIHAVDPRHYTGDLSAYIREQGIDELAAVYSLEQLGSVGIYSELS